MGCIQSGGASRPGPSGRWRERQMCRHIQPVATDELGLSRPRWVVVQTPGILPAPPLFGSLRRVVPSRLTRLAACALREVFSAGGQTPLLPSPPGAVLGTVAHKLLEKAGRGEFTGWSKEAIYDEWDRLVAGVEARMS